VADCGHKWRDLDGGSVGPAAFEGFESLPPLAQAQIRLATSVDHELSGQPIGVSCRQLHD
jgi:hypothetical protein